ncbi:hypothetical protein ElyMa_006762900 [Elysia marginata]|uniref:Reverse transcriptase domain-containing protein n=1 Tax=Elysia marginata TaxID=1093978 RepID=A0AAV4IY79_9GAST|nr:hypothetical protein ElyMa_006762900 [Elysia marginata]
MLEEKNRRYRAYLNEKSPSRKAALDNNRNTVKRKLREMQNTWLSQKADEIQSYADRNDTKWFYDAAVTHQRRRHQKTSPCEQQPRPGYTSTLPEVEKAIGQLSRGKALGADGILADVYKHGGPQTRKKLTELFHTMWVQRAVP